jgi:hypothetical protein
LACNVWACNTMAVLLRTFCMPDSGIGKWLRCGERSEAEAPWSPLLRDCSQSPLNFWYKTFPMYHLRIFSSSLSSASMTPSQYMAILEALFSSAVSIRADFHHDLSCALSFRASNNSSFSDHLEQY